MSPSMEKTESVTTSVGAAASPLRRARGRGKELGEVVHVAVAVHGEVGAREPAAVNDAGVVELVGEHPARPGRRVSQSTPRLAANPVGKQTAASMPFHVGERRSSSSCTGASR